MRYPGRASEQWRLHQRLAGWASCPVEWLGPLTMPLERTPQRRVQLTKNPPLFVIEVSDPVSSFGKMLLDHRTFQQLTAQGGIKSILLEGIYRRLTEVKLLYPILELLGFIHCACAKFQSLQQHGHVQGRQAGIQLSRIIRCHDSLLGFLEAPLWLDNCEPEGLTNYLRVTRYV